MAGYFRTFLLVLLLALAPTAAHGAGGSVALTFDDLPALTLHDDQTYVDHLSRDILAGLRRHHFAATGFVNEGKLDDIDRRRQIGVLEAWLHAGMGLGNHTFSHASATKVGAQAFIADIEKGEPVTRRLLARHGERLIWFRHPYLETGATLAERDEIDNWLTAHNYRVAPVTMENSDWEFSEPYDDALTRGDQARAAQIRKEYVDYSEGMIAWHQRAAHVLFGRDIAFVMLLHASRLNADCLDQLAGLFKQAHLKVVPLASAMRDKAYSTPDRYAGKDGINWLERWARSMGKDLPWSDYRDPPKDIADDYDRVDNDR